MAIWSYRECITEPERLLPLINMASCVFCGGDMDSEDFSHWPPAGDAWRLGTFETQFSAYCVRCGWWNKRIFGTRVRRHKDHGSFVSVTRGAAGKLRSLDLTDITVPLSDIRAYLLAKYDSRFNVDWRVFENTVASVFQDFGFQARVTARSNDGGIDVIFDGPDDSTIGVQVKRYRNKIQADQIRELTGALVQSGITSGVFVTTSQFTCGARASADSSTVRGVPVQLIDAQRFYDALEIAQVNKPHPTISDLAGSTPKTIITERTSERRPLAETPQDDGCGSGLDSVTGEVIGGYIKQMSKFLKAITGKKEMLDAQQK